MAISIATLRNAASQTKPQNFAKSFDEALAKKLDTAFLCHSHKDKLLAEGLQNLLMRNGWNVYIDWQDTDMPDTPDQVTAARIKLQISTNEWFIFLATNNSTASRWCPWEIGYADSEKQHDKILLVATRDDNNWYGNEYLNLYRRISTTKNGNFAVFSSGSQHNGILLENFS